MQVEPQVTFKGLEKSEFLQSIIAKRIGLLERKHPRIIGCRVVVEVAYRGSESAKVPLHVAVEVEVPGRNTLVAKDAAQRHDSKSDQTAPINNAFDAIERQLLKSAEIQEGKVKQSEAVPQTGMIARLFPEQNYGFLEASGTPELYFTRNAVVGGTFDDLRVGMLVYLTLATTEGPMGPQASSVRLVDKTLTTR